MDTLKVTEEARRRQLLLVWLAQMSDARSNAETWWSKLSPLQRREVGRDAPKHLDFIQWGWWRAMAVTARNYLDLNWSAEMGSWNLLSEPQKLEMSYRLMSYIHAPYEAAELAREATEKRLQTAHEELAKKVIRAAEEEALAVERRLRLEADESARVAAVIERERQKKIEAVNLERLEQSRAWAVTWNNLSHGDQDRYRKNERELKELEKKVAEVAFRFGNSGVHPSVHEQINEIKQKQLIFERDKKFIDEQAAQRVREAEETRNRSRDFGHLHKPQNTKKVTSVEKAMSLLKKLTADMARVQKVLKELNDK